MRKRWWGALLAAVGTAVIAAPVRVAVQSEDGRQPYSGREWAAPGGDLWSTRFSTLAQIDTRTVEELGAAWVTEIPRRGVSKASPVIVDGRMFVTTTSGDILALDPVSGKQLWAMKPEGAFNGNRGMGAGDGLLFAGLGDSTVIAISQETGELVWRKEREPEIPAQGMSSAPAYADGVVVAVVTGGDNFARGRVMGLDARTGRQLWNFEAVPGPGEPGHETWPQDSDVWKYGGGAIWMTPSIDRELGLVYVGTGNAVPQFGGELRPGDNLYNNSVVALELKTGKLRWFNQLIHHDLWEHDLGMPLILYDTVVDGKPRKGLMAARTDGFFFMLDRETGKPLLPIEERPVPQDAFLKTAPTQPFPVGGDRLGPECAPKDLVPEGFVAGCYFQPLRADMPNVMMPHMNTRFAPMSYNPGTGYFYATACVHPKWVRRVESGWVFVLPRRVAGVSQYGLLAAIDSRTNRIVWQTRVPHAICAGSGTSTTAGNLVFHTAPAGAAQAYDARNGDLLWEFQTGEVGASSGNGPGGGPISVYEAGGEQYVAVVNNHHVWAFKLRGRVPPRQAPEPPPIVYPWEGVEADATTIELGRVNVVNIRNASRREEWSDDYAVTPVRVRAARGATLTFSNKSALSHRLAARDQSWATGVIPPGESRTVTVPRAGTVEYVCLDHPWSVGQLIVE